MDNTNPANRAQISLGHAFQHCEDLAYSHYENFPVASFFLPKHLRPAVATIYAFARTADDLADEGNRSPAERLVALNDWQTKLDECYQGNASHPIFVALAEVVRQKNIPKQLLANLLTAFKMDVTVHRYATFADVLHYCRHSANPVGRIVLHLFDDASERHCELSDHICTALQLANFWQDVERDLRKDRMYAPLEDIERFGYTEKEFLYEVVDLRREHDERFRALMQFQVERTRQFFEQGKPLLNLATRQLRFELKLTWNGGMQILKRIERQSYNVFSHRPTISSADKFSILLRALFHRP